MDQPYPKAKVILALTVGLTSIGFAPILVKLATPYSAFLVAAYRTVLAVVLLLPVWFLSEESKTRHNDGNHKWILLSGVLLGLHFICWIGSLYFTSVASASVLVTIHPILLIVTERVLFKIKFPILAWIGVCVAFFGSALLGITDSSGETDFQNPLLGNTLAFTAACIFAVYFLIGRKVRVHRSWLGYVFPVYAYAALTCVFVFIIIDPLSFTIDRTLLVLGLGMAIGPQILGHGALNYAVRYVSPTLLSSLILIEPVFASTIAFFLFSELPPTLSFFAMGITLIGVALTWRRKRAA
ncbi:MAG: DMT family transporter [Bacteroidota bacterium]